MLAEKAAYSHVVKFVLVRAPHGVQKVVALSDDTDSLVSVVSNIN